VRAEIVGGFFNAVFLLALCVSIGIEAITRFFQPPDIKDPRIMLVVGCLGLASNLVGFFVLGGHGHSHSHGGDAHEGHGHSTSHKPDEIEAAERGEARITDANIRDDSGRIIDVLPETVLLGRQASNTSEYLRQVRAGGETNEARHSSSTPIRGRQRRRTGHHARLTSIDDQNMHPSSFRQEILAASRSHPAFTEDESDSSTDELAESDPPSEQTPLIAGHNDQSCFPHRRRSTSEALHKDHNHNKPKQNKKKGGHSHSHGHDMGMRAMILHVIGDALGNAGVIATALVIWFVEWPGKLYFDPLVSLFITAIIMRTAWPITRQTGKVLLQATPEHIDLNDIREDIQALPGVVSCHHVHIWQLSDTKIVASLHIQVAFPISEEGGERYMELARRARKCLHAYGIHSATIQPEFCTDKSHLRPGWSSDGAYGDATEGVDGSDGAARGGPSRGSDTTACLLECVDDCGEQGCCPALSREGSQGDLVGAARQQHHCAIGSRS
jgi:solute carrier family 30 (zinc transporter), member 1